MNLLSIAKLPARLATRSLTLVPCVLACLHAVFPQGPRSFFSEIISSINDIRFSPCGRYILSRDYMTLKVSTLVHCEANWKAVSCGNIWLP